MTLTDPAVISKRNPSNGKHAIGSPHEQEGANSHLADPDRADHFLGIGPGLRRET